MPEFRLFILGAGFSKPAGLPLGEELLSGVRDLLRYGPSSFHLTSALEKEINEWESLYPGKEVNLERVLAYSHRKHYLRLRGSDEFHAQGSVAIVRAKRAIQSILINSTPRNTPDLYRDFAGRLTPNDVVLTFNYDTLLEQALDGVGTPYSLTPQWWLTEPLDESGLKYIDLLKLHGSVDWYDRHYHDNSVRWHSEQRHSIPNHDPLFGPNPSVPHESLARGSTDVYGTNILPRVFRVPEHAHHFPIEDDGLSTLNVVPFLLPPAFDKILGFDPILDLWENMHRIHHQFSSIVIIGYSMPPYDNHAFETLGRLLIEYQQAGIKNRWNHRRRPIQLVTLADSTQEALENMPFLDDGKTLVWREGFALDALDWIDWD